MLTPSGLRQAVRDMHDARANYFVTGGVAYDGLRGSWTREHKDLDVFVFNESVTRLIDELSAFGYECYRKGSIYLLRMPDLEIGMLPLKRDGLHLVLDTNRARARYPVELFTAGRAGHVDGTRFPIVRNEVLVANAAYDDPIDAAFARSLPVDARLLASITIEQKPEAQHALERIA